MIVNAYSNPFLLDFLIVAERAPQDERDQLESLTGDKYNAEGAAVGAWNTIGPKWVFKSNEGKPLAVAGYVQQRPGVWRDFMINTPEAFADHWFSITRHAIRIMNAMFLSGQAHRLECVSLASRTKAHKWYATLGLHKEGIMRGYCANGADAIMFARCKH
jgi:hypothetical protein